MGRQSENDDDAAKAVISSAAPRLRQAPAQFREDSSSAASSPSAVPVNKKKSKAQDKKKGKGSLSQASGTFVEEESKEEIAEKPMSSKGGKQGSEKEKIDAKPSGVGMFAGAHRERRRPPPADEDSVDTVDEQQGEPGAYAEGGRSGQDDGADDNDTVSPEESTVPVQERQDPNRELLIAAYAVDVGPVVEAEPTEPKIEQEEEPAEQEPKWLSQRRNQYIVLAFLLLVIGIVVAVVLLVTGDDDGGGQIATDLENPSRQTDDDTPTQMPTSSPSLSPSISPAPTSLYDRLFELVAPFSGEAVLEDSSTPQSQALQWAIGDFAFGEWSDDVILERYALATLFYATSGGRWFSVTDFLLQLPYCVWQGVECSNEVITSVSLPSENLSGSLPREIGLLTTLTSLNVANNSLVGSIPTEFGFLTNLEFLDLSLDVDNPPVRRRSAMRRRMEDTIPQSFLTGPMPSEIGLLMSLSTLDLSGNSISGNLPSELGQLRRILNLILRDNMLQGSVPLQIGFLTSLQRLSLERNLLTGDVPNTLCSSFSLIQDLRSDCLAEIDGDKPAEVVCKCCNVCCDVNNACQDFDVTAFPSSSPSTSFPSASPSKSPSAIPSSIPSSVPSSLPSSLPSRTPSFAPSMPPSFNPTPSGTPEPTVTASQSPSKGPTLVPSSSPSVRPTGSPSITTSTPPTVGCRIDENSCVGNRACNGAVDLCTEPGSCSGRNACRSATGLGVAQGSCVGTSACQEATGIISSNSCTDDNACANFGGISIGSNSCNCFDCCSCYETGELPDIISSNSCNVRGECCSTPSPTTSPTKNPTQRPTTAAPTPQPTPSPTSAFDAAFAEMMSYAETKSSRSSLSDTNSPQYKAVEWLAQDRVDNGSNWSGYELLQRYVLRVLYHSTGGENWSLTATNSWFGASSVCDWGSSNAQCNGDGQKVDRIDLASDNLQGTIPTELGQLTALTYMNFANNQLTGALPTQLIQLTALVWLGWRSNQLSGRIPSQLGQLTALTWLNLRENRFSGTIPNALTQLTNLSNLYLDNNNLIGDVPSAFCAAPFPDFRTTGPALYADCISEVQCDCCDQCYDASGNKYCWNDGSGFEAC